MTPPQRAVATLAAQGNDFRAIAEVLPLSYRQVRQTLRHAERKLRAVLPRVIEQERREIRWLLGCIRNVYDTRPAPVYHYAPVPGGGHRLVSFRPRPEGECPEDLLEPRLSVLAELSNRLAECAVHFCG